MGPGPAGGGPGPGEEPGGSGRAAGPLPRVPEPRGASGAGARPASMSLRRAAPEQPARQEGPDKQGDEQTAGRYSHAQLMSLLGAWALRACPPDEAAVVERHLNDCASCAEEGIRLREAVSLLEPQRSLDLDPALRPRVLAGCLARRPARHPLPDWAAPYDAEAARLDALLRDMADDEWLTPVRLRWFAEDEPREQATTVAGVLDHLLAVDGLLARALGLPDPLGDASAAPLEGGPAARTRARWRTAAAEGTARPGRARRRWREQARALVRAAGEAGSGADLTVAYPVPELGGGERLPVADAYLDRAFACWVHAGDIAEAVAYPYDAPSGPQLRMLVDLAARRLPGSLAGRRRAGLSGGPGRLAEAGAPGRTLHLEVEGAGGGHWYIPLDSPGAPVCESAAVAHVALEDVAFCQLAAGRLTLDEAAAGADGDRAVVRDVLRATAALSRM